MRIRLAQRQDFESILAIYNKAILTYQITGDLLLATTESRKAWFEFHLNSEKYPLWVVEEKNEVVGWFSFSPFYDRPAFAHASEISIYLDPPVHGRGYGSQIIEYMKSQMLSKNINILVAYVFELNTISLKMMDKHGFISWGRLPNIANMGKDDKGHERWRTLVMMAYEDGIKI
ncbi:GNAT family N-acetyltransferase [Otariodibacter oris]|uniref:Phosphinothricin acetyltransferase n=1 Tax=Otariodibacter oris TaxID=1032623 RepID=A0A420XIL9_9PAST|nr:GNAT family N-acetyltransferase [Otariodibacter oris]QGM80728.1 GNAT family N-acetyltransferase [Otariodibacter oris]RKR77109.1 phosphinothricin acetyltransferase [Otariodibacter oris]